MDRFKVCGVIVAISLTMACKPKASMQPESVVRTDETRKVVNKFCNQYEAEGDPLELVPMICECLQNDRGMTNTDRWCNESSGSLKLGAQRLQARVLAESAEAFRDTAGNPLTSEDKICQESLTEFYVEHVMTTMLDACKRRKVSDLQLERLLDNQSDTSNDACWVMHRMSPEACVLARPCTNSGPSSVSHLPLSQQAFRDLEDAGLSQVPEGKSIKLCNEHIQDIHFLKDPANAELNFNLSYANLLSFGRSYEHIPYGPANCHGTAQAVVGGILDQTVVEGIAYHSPQVRNTCAAEAETMYGSAKEKRGGSSPLALDLPIERGGYLINMDYDESCQATDCGRVDMTVNSCDAGKMVAHIFFNGMCVKCWEQKLNQAGLRTLSENASWRDLKPGCVLTAQDHSVAFLMESDGMCYYYESTTPFGPPLLRVNQCANFFHGFSRRFCPQNPLTFEFKMSAGQ